MKVSINEIKRLGYETVVDLPVEELVKRIGAQLGEVDDVEDLGKKYQGVVVATIVSVSKHPQADRLNVCLIDDGNTVQHVERDERGYVQVVCGAPNVREGMVVAWLPPGVTVPNTYHHEPFVLESRELRGVVSHGMLASPKELALGDSHEGILEIDTPVHSGQAFAEVYHLDDYIISIENKMFTHRPDCFGILGVAREIAGIQQQSFVSPEWYRHPSVIGGGEGLSLTVHNEITDVVPRFMTVAISDIYIKDSPLWLQTALIRLGSRPINNVVDITNYLMLVTAQPLHAYDYDKLATQTIAVRRARHDETVSLLNGKTLTLHTDDIVITDGEKAIGIGGVMGGAYAEVDSATKNILLEVASFDMYAIRRTAMRHGLFTDAVTRFNKGQSAHQNDRVMAKAVEFFQELCGGRVASSITDIKHGISDQAPVRVTAGFINDRLGLDISENDMSMILQNVECDVTIENDNLVIQPPFWRTDIAIPEDVVEEIGRLYGYDKLSQVLPSRRIQPAERNTSFDLKQAIRESLARCGNNELLTYSFVHANIIKKSGQNPDEAYQLSNALSPDLQYYRLSVLPSLLDKIHQNVKAGYQRFGIFEIGKGHNAARHGSDDEGLPGEFRMVDFVYAASQKSHSGGAAFYTARRILDQLAHDLGIELDYAVPKDDEPNYPIVKPFDWSRSAYVTVKNTDIFLGMVGEFKTTVAKSFKLPPYTAGFSLSFDELLTVANYQKVSYRQTSRYPSTTKDVCFKIDSSATYSSVYSTLSSKIAELSVQATITLVDIYQDENNASKQMTFRFVLSDTTKTLTTDEANNLVSTIADEVVAAHNATIV